MKLFANRIILMSVILFAELLTGCTANSQKSDVNLSSTTSTFVKAEGPGKIVFSGQHGQFTDIFIMDADGANKTNLTSFDKNLLGASNGFPCLSPDGSQIVFISFLGNDNGIFKMNADGSNKVKLMPNNVGTDPVWSPDSKKIAFQSEIDGNVNIYMVNADGTGQTQITTHGGMHPRWSPDGKKIAFNSRAFESGPFNIYTIDIDGSNISRVTNESGSIYGFSWSSDGNKLVYALLDAGLQPEGLFTILPDGSGRTALPTDGVLKYAITPVWSPDSSRIAFSTLNHRPQEIYSVKADGTDLMQLTDSVAMGTDVNSAPSWSYSNATTSTVITKTTSKTAHIVNNPGKIVFDSYRNGYPEIFIMNDDGSNQIRLTNRQRLADGSFTSNENDFSPCLSPDGTQIAFTSDRDGNWEIYKMNADGSHQEQLTNNIYQNSNPAWSPDNKKIAFYSNMDGIGNIYVMNTDGTNQLRITTGGAGLPVWSPDSKKIAFLLSASDSQGNIYIMNADGSKQTRVTNPQFGAIWGLSWSPDGNKLLYSLVLDYESQGIFIINTDGSHQTALPTNGALKHACNPVWSPDGTRIAFNTTRHQPQEIYTVKTDGTDLRQLTNTDITLGIEAGNDSPSWGNTAPN